MDTLKNKHLLTCGFFYKLILSVLGFALISPITKSFAGEPVLICGEPWPPWLYEQESDNKKRKEIAALHLENFSTVARMKCNAIREFRASTIPDSAWLHPGYLLPQGNIP